jgi:curli biogenesis system outer membrane secretion channel CsgG
MLACFAFVGPAPALADASLAVMPIQADGIDPMFAANFDPGKAFTDILTNKLVDLGKLSIVDRQHIEQIFAEQKLAQSADFITKDAVQLGHMVGANFLIVGRITHLDKIGSKGIGVGNVLGNFGINNVGTSGDKYRLAIAIQLLDSATGRIVKSYTYDDTRSAKGVLIGDPGTGRGYSSSEFGSSVVGQLLNSAAGSLAQKISDTSLTVTNIPSINAIIIAIDGTDAILNKGSQDGVQVGMFFQTFHQISAKDPSTGKTIVTDVPDGSVEVRAVSPNSSVARVVSGKPAVSGIARTQP